MKRLIALAIVASLCFPIFGAKAWWQSIQQVGVSGAPPAGLALDGNVGAAMNNVTTASVNLTTTKTNDVIIVLVSHAPFTTETVSVTSPHLTFTLRATANRFNGNFAYEYEAIASSTLSAETITFTSSQPGGGILNAFAISGANTSSPFDPNVSLPSPVGTGGAGGAFPTGATTNPNTLIFGIIYYDSTANPLPGSGWGALQTLSGPPFPQTSLTEYQIASSPQPSLTLDSPTGPSTNVDVALMDAVTQ